MAGLNHDFYLISVTERKPEECAHFFEMDGGVTINDDNLSYMADSLNWIPTYNANLRQKGTGLHWYGPPTVISLEGASITNKIFLAWAELFKLGPETLNLRGYYVLGDEDFDGYYDRLEIPRDEMVSKLSTIASYAQKIIDSDGQYFILHMGI